MASRIGTRELRAQLAVALRRASAGERIVVTDSGRPLAQLGPIDAPNISTSNAIETNTIEMDELVARGVVIPPRRRSAAGPRIIPVDVFSGVRFDQVVRDLR
jgi:prevent-host-death family protein